MSRAAVVTGVAAVAGTVLAAGYAAKRKRSQTAEEEEALLAQKRAKYAKDTFASHITEHDGKGLVVLSPGRLWHVTARFSGNGPPWRRMIIFKPPGATGLVLLSPTAVDEETMAEIEKLGTPSVLIVPNSYHRTDVAVFKNRYPSAKVACPPGFSKKAVREVVEVDFCATELIKRYPECIRVMRIGGLASEDGEDFEFAYEFKCADNTWAYAVTDTLMNFRDASFMNWVFGAKGLAQPEGCPCMGRLSKLLVHSKKGCAEHYRSLAKRTDISMILMAHGNVYIGDTAAAFNAIADDLDPASRQKCPTV